MKNAYKSLVGTPREGAIKMDLKEVVYEEGGLDSCGSG
jgi:hypothetical protein